MLSQRLQTQAQFVSIMLLGGIAVVLFTLAMGVNTSPTQAREQTMFGNQALAYTFKAQTPESRNGAAIGKLQGTEIGEPTNTPLPSATATASATATPPRSSGNICDGVFNDYDLAIAQQASAKSVFSGETVTYTVIIANCGTLVSKAFSFKNVIPPKLQGSSGWVFEHADVIQFDSGEWIIPNMIAKEITTATLVGKLVSTQACPVTNKVEVVSKLVLTEPNKSNNTAEVEVKIIDGTACTQYAYLPAIIKEPTSTPTNTSTSTAIPTATATFNSTATAIFSGTATAIARLTATAQAGPRIRYQENFNSTSNKKWYAGTTDSGFCTSVYRDLAYDMEAKKGQESSGKTTCWRAAPSAAEALKAVYGQFEVKAYHREGQSDSMFGIYINGKGADELYLFRIWPNTSVRTDSTKRCSNGGDWELLRIKGGTSKGLINGRCHASIKDGTGADATNVLKIIHERNGKISIYINGTLIDTYTDTSQLTSGYGTGIYERSEGTKDIGIRFDDFTIYQEP